MANVYGKNPLVIDTAFVLATSPFPTRACIRRVVWAKQTAAGHRLLLQDKSGTTILDVIASSANDTQEFNLDTWTNGIICNIIDSGICEIYI